MTTDRPQTSVSRLREAVTIRVQATSLRSVARQVGMSPSGLDKFLNGAMPYQKSRRRLFDWLHRERHNLGADLTVDGIAAALGSLVRDLPPDRRELALNTLLGTLQELYATHTETAPAWLAEILQRAADGSAFPEDEVPPSRPPAAEDVAQA
jgi:transcriptional regulator with XRE-family HTH domain